MPYAPYDYKCPYKDSCPHLDWLSTQWALESYHRGRDVYDEHLRVVDNFYNRVEELRIKVRNLEKENAELKAKLKLLHQKQFKPNKKQKAAVKEKDEPPLTSTKKKRGAPVGHPGWSRPKPKRIDRIVHVPAPLTCPHCLKEDLAPYDGLHEHVQEDIVIEPRTEVVKYIHEQSFCSTCNRPVVQPGEGEMLNAHIGPVARSVAVFLRYRIGVSYRKTKKGHRVSEWVKI